MSINLLKDDLKNQFNISISGLYGQLKELKLNGKYISKIYWCDPTLFPNLEDNCGLIYVRNNDIQFTTLSGHAYDILKNQPLNDVYFTFTKTNSRNKKQYTATSYSKGKAQNADVIDDGFYSVSSVIGNSTYKVVGERRNYITYRQDDISVGGSGAPTEYSIYMNPIDDSIARVILNWDQKPYNLDLHIVCPDGSQLSYRNTKNQYGYMNYGDTNGYGPELITIVDYARVDCPLKIGGDFDFWVNYNSNQGQAFNCQVKLFTEQLGAQFYESDAEQDNINRYGYQWHAAKLHVKSGLDPIELQDSDLITYTKQLKKQQYSYLKSYTSFFNRNSGTPTYSGIVKYNIDNNQFVLNYNTIMYLLKDYPFVTNLYLGSSLIESYSSEISDNYSTSSEIQDYKGYTVKDTLTNLPSAGTYNLKFYLNSSMKDKNEVYYDYSFNTKTTSAVLDLNNIFYNKIIPITLYDSQKNIFEEFEYIYVPKTNERNPYYVIRKHWNKNKYYNFNEKIQNTYIKFTLGMDKTINLSSLIPNNDYDAPSSFAGIETYVYRNNQQLNNYKVKDNGDNTISLYGQLNCFKQRYFDPKWITNNNYYYYHEGYTYKNYPFSDLYCNSNYDTCKDYNFQNYQNYINYLTDTDSYRIEILDSNNILSGYQILSTKYEIEWINKSISNLNTNAGNVYLYFSELEPVLDPYIIDSISSQTQGNMQFAYEYDNNGVTLKFKSAAPSGQNCVIKFKRIKTDLSRTELNSYKNNPHVYVKTKDGTLDQIANWGQDEMVIDYFQEISGYNQLYLTYIDFNKMYSLSSNFVNEYNSDLNVTLRLSKTNEIQQYVGMKFLLFDSNNKVVFSSETMLNSSWNFTIKELPCYKTYTAKIYGTYNRSLGNLSGIYNDSFTSYLDRSNGNYNNYVNNQIIEEDIQFNSFSVTLTGNVTYVDKSFRLDYGQFKGSVYTADDTLFNNDFNGYGILTNLEKDIQYNCAWNGTSIYSIDYIYPGNYKLELYYGGILIHTINSIAINQDNIADTTAYKVKTTYSFFNFSYHLYNNQTSGQLTYFAPTDPKVTLPYHYDDDSALEIGLYGKNSLKQEETQYNKQIYLYRSENRNDRLVNAQLIKQQKYKLTSRFGHLGDYQYYYQNRSLQVEKILQGDKEIPFELVSGVASAVIIDGNDITSGQVLNIYFKNYYFDSASIQINCGSSNQYFRVNGLSCMILDENSSIIYTSDDCYYNYFYDYTSANMGDVIEQIKYQGDYGYGGNLNCWYYIYGYYYQKEKFFKTGNYTVIPFKHFKFDENKPCNFESYTFGIYDDGYQLNNFCPSDGPTGRYYIYPKFVSKTVSGDMIIDLPLNNLISIPMFSGKQETLDKFEYFGGNFIRSKTMNANPVYTDYDWWSWSATSQCSYGIPILSGYNYWICGFDSFTVSDCSKNLVPVGLYEITSSVTLSSIPSGTQSIGSIESYGPYNGIKYDMSKIQHGKSYALVFESENNIIVKGYLRDCNDQQWYNYSFNIKITNTQDTSLVYEVTGVTNGRFSFGTIKKGTYDVEITRDNDSRNLVADDYKQVTFSTSTSDQVLFKTKFGRNYLRGYVYRTNSSSTLPNERGNIQICNLTQETQEYRLKYSRYGDYQSWYDYGQYIDGTYNMKFIYILDTATITKDKLNINQSTSGFSIDQELLKSYISGSYKQQNGDLYLGTITDKNGYIVSFDSGIDGSNLTGMFTTSNFKDIASSLTIRIGQMPSKYENVVLSGNKDQRKHFYCNWWYCWCYNGIYYDNLPNELNLLETLSSTDELYYTSGNTRSLGIGNTWFKCGTTFNSFLYHDGKLIGNGSQTIYGNSQSCRGTNTYETGSIKINFIDKITGQGMQQNYGSDWNRYLRVYHKGCVSGDATAEECINAGQIFSQTNWFQSTSYTFSNLYANEDYYLQYNIGYEREFNDVAEFNDVPAGGTSEYTVTIPYGYVRFNKYFRDRTTNSGINGSYAQLILTRCEDDGYDKTYTYNADDQGSITGIRTGHYTISLIGNMPDKATEYYNYQQKALITSDFSMTNYVNTTPLIANVYLYNSDGSICTNTNLYIYVYQNGFVYTSSQYTDTATGRTRLTLFNIPFTIKILNASGSVQEISAIYNKAPSDSSKSSISFSDNTFSCDSMAQTEIFHVVLK